MIVREGIGKDEWSGPRTPADWQSPTGNRRPAIASGLKYCRQGFDAEAFGPSAQRVTPYFAQPFGVLVTRARQYRNGPTLPQRAFSTTNDQAGPRRAVFLTAGAAGMYCGSCMHDNALARAMIAGGVDCLLQPVYTPIRTDESSVAGKQVFFGGIHIYLLEQLPWFRFVPEPLRRTLDWKPLLNLATRRTHSADAAMLGRLAVSMLRGRDGNQAGEVRRLTDWLATDVRPGAVLMTNLLIGGAIPVIRQRLPETRVVVLLQGDDIFLDYLAEPYQSQAIELCRSLVPGVDRFVVHSRFYAEKMASMFQIPSEKIVVTPLSIDTSPYELASVPLSGDSASPRQAGFRVGFLARIAPEKGLHHLVDAFARLASDPQHDDVTLHAAGWLGDQHHGYLEQIHATIAEFSLDHRFTYHGSPSLAEKVQYLRSLDLLCVPTDYHDPKGLFVLEAMAAGVPVLQPDHGAFGELIAATGGGRVFRPGDPDDLHRQLLELKADAAARSSLASAGLAAVHAEHSITRAAQRMTSILFD